jgi:vacuolar-type H+-ATPase catalytic subunit A/Vma1
MNALDRSHKFPSRLTMRIPLFVERSKYIVSLTESEETSRSVVGLAESPSGDMGVSVLVGTK